MVENNSESHCQTKQLDITSVIWIIPISVSKLSWLTISTGVRCCVSVLDRMESGFDSHSYAPFAKCDNAPKKNDKTMSRPNILIPCVVLMSFMTCSNVGCRQLASIIHTTAPFTYLKAQPFDPLGNQYIIPSNLQVDDNDTKQRCNRSNQRITKQRRDRAHIHIWT